MENPAYRPEWQVSHQDVDIEYADGLSNCCGAKVYAEIGICADCKDHCEIITEQEKWIEHANDVIKENQKSMNNGIVYNNPSLT